jgi:hydroxymethylpyrimidine/phosphomethylpyrimidine kinase
VVRANLLEGRTMMQTGTTWRFTVHARGGAGSSEPASDILERHLERLQEELLLLEKCNEDVHDSGVGASLATGEVEIELTVDLPLDEAVKRARYIVRTAIHAAGGFTPSWEGQAPPPVDVIEYEPEGTELCPA